MIHRDIKPENILLAGGHARVADFGIARALRRGRRRRAADGDRSRVGTPAYMSPEQARPGRASSTAGATCMRWAACCTRCSPGEPPFTGPTAQAVIARHALDPVPSLGVLRQELPPAFSRRWRGPGKRSRGSLPDRRRSSVTRSPRGQAVTAPSSSALPFGVAGVAPRAPSRCSFSFVAAPGS